MPVPGNRRQAATRSQADRPRIAADFSGAFVLVASDDLNAVSEFSLMWTDLMEFRLVPVIEDAELVEVPACRQ